MLTRLTATVTMSAPDAAIDCAITACDGYFPLPTINLEVNVRPAMTSGVSFIESPRVMWLSAADEVDDLDAVAFVDERHLEHRPLENDEVVLDSHAARINRQPRQQVGDRQRPVKRMGFAVERDQQGTWLRRSQRTARRRDKSR